MSTEAKVGLFVILSATLFIGTVYYVGNEQWGRHVNPYRTYLRYAGGVEPGSAVLFGGIAAGRVTAVRAWDEVPVQQRRHQHRRPDHRSRQRHAV